MALLTNKYFVDLQTRMQLVSAAEYDRLRQDLVWDQIASIADLTGVAESIIEYPIENAEIEHNVAETYTNAKDRIYANFRMTSRFHATGLKIMRSKFTDGPYGAAAAADFSKAMGALFAYDPQQLVFDKIKENGICQYDNAVFFGEHPISPNVNGVATTALKFKNRFTGAAAGVYPGALPIDESVSPEVALTNLSKLVTYVRSIPQANGKLPLKLRIKSLIGPPRLAQRLAQLTDAQFLGTTGSSDVRPIIRANGLGTPIVVDELGAGFGGDDRTYYVAVEQITPSIGPILFAQKEPYEIVYFDPTSDSEINKRQWFEWRVRGRSGCEYGLPQLLFRVDAV